MQTLRQVAADLINQSGGWYLFYHPTEGRRLSRPNWQCNHLTKDSLQLMRLLQLLKAIFGINLAGQWESHVTATALRTPLSRATARTPVPLRPGIYQVCLNQPYIQLTQAMASTAMKIHTPLVSGGTVGSTAASVEQEDSSRWLQWYHHTVG